jgi:hypothetical protein
LLVSRPRAKELDNLLKARRVVCVDEVMAT